MNIVIDTIVNKLPNAHPVVIGGGGVGVLEVFNSLPAGNLSSFLQLAIGIITVVKLIFQNRKQKKELENNSNT